MTSPAGADTEVVHASRPQPRRGVSLRDAGPPIALLVIFAVFAALSPGFRTIGNVQNIMDAAAVLAVVTCGITFVLMMGSIDLSAPGVMGAAAIAAPSWSPTTATTTTSGCSASCSPCWWALPWAA